MFVINILTFYLFSLVIKEIYAYTAMHTQIYKIILCSHGKLTEAHILTYIHILLTEAHILKSRFIGPPPQQVPMK